MKSTKATNIVNIHFDHCTRWQKSRRRKGNERLDQRIIKSRLMDVRDVEQPGGRCTIRFSESRPEPVDHIRR